MNYPFYTDKPIETCCQTPVELPPPPQGFRPESFEPDKDYLPDPGLVDAVNAALLLRQPLLLTGEPGTGKTQLAYHLACQLGYQVFKFDTKSDSKARDLFYTYNAVEHFRSTQLKEKDKSPHEFITYKALGLAILLANPYEKIEKYLPSDFKQQIQQILGPEFDFQKPQRFIVLIDEIDKAPRDFPNDILNEVEKFYFQVPELDDLGNICIEAPIEKQPILILTSNSEKSLPDAFLRRCIYYDIPFPEEARLRQIVEIRLRAQIDDINQFLSQALELFFKLRGGLRKKPATAELLNWLLVLREMFQGVDNPLIKYPEQTAITLSTLVKSKDDQKAAERVLEQFQK
jgi:MoxR-like ATPase